MAKNKHVRTMNMVTAAQQVVEQAARDKFAAVEEFVQPVKKTQAAVEKKNGRFNPQLSCTISPEDKELLNALALYASNKHHRLLNTSTIVRALIRLGNKHKDELEF